MNESIHNEKVAAFQVKVKEHENDVIDGKKIAHDINEFVELHDELNGVIKEYEGLYKDTQDVRYKIELDAYLKEELDYLDLISELMDNLEEYHDKIGIVSANEIQQEWEDIRTMVIRNNLSRSLKRMEKLAQNEEKYATLYNEYKSKHDKLLDKAINAEYRFIKKFTLEQNTTELESNIVEKTPSLLLNEDVYEKMNLEEKIKYLEIIMKNIEKTSGKKRTGVVNGKRINVTKKYYARYAHYTSLLNNLYEEKKLQEEEIIEYATKTEISPEAKALKEEMNKLSDRIERLAYHDNMAVDFSETTNVILPDGTIYRILKTDVEHFEELKQRYIELKGKYDNLATLNNGIDFENLGTKIEAQVSNEISSDDIEKYWSARHQTEENRRAISVMEMRAEEANEDECVHVESIDGKQIRILKSDLETYENIEKNNNKAFEVIEKIMLKNDQELNKEEQEALYQAISEINNDSNKSIKDKIVEKIKFLRKNGKSDESLSNKLKGLLNEYSIVNKTKRFINIATLAHLFRQRGYDKEEAKQLAERFIEPYELLKSKKHSDDQKKNMFSKASDAIKSYFDTSNDEIENEEIKEKEGKLKEILKAAKSLPKKAAQYISKVKETKKSKDKSKLKNNVKKHWKKIAVTLGLATVITVAANSCQKDKTIDTNPKITTESDSLANENPDLYAGITEEINESLSAITDEELESLGSKIEEQANKEEEYENIQQEDVTVPVEDVQDIYIGDVFTIDNNAPIYTNMYDAKDEINQKSAYFEDNSERIVTGIAYEYNGSMILIDKNDPDKDAKMAALEANGAIQVGVRSENEHSQGYEGYYNIDDINIGGRGR